MGRRPNKSVKLLWYAKTPRGWRRFPVTYHEVKEGRNTHHRINHGWVNDEDEYVQYPEGRYQLRRYNSDRRPVYTSVETQNPIEAEQAYQREKRKVIQGTGNELNLLKTAIPGYLKYCSQRQAHEAEEQARNVLDEFMTIPDVRAAVYVRNIALRHILAFHEKLRSRGIAERTISNKHNRLMSFLRFCKVDVSFVTKKDRPKYEKAKVTIYNSAEIKAILGAVDATDDYMRVAISMTLKLGLRESEATHSEWSDVDWAHKTFRVKGKPHLGFKVKDNEQRDIPIPADLLQLLEDWQKKQKQNAHQRQHLGKLILGTSSDKVTGHLLRSLKNLARRANLNCGECESCKGKNKECENWTLHKFRRTYATTLLRNQLDARTVMRLMGHSDLNTTLKYLRPESTSEMQDRINAVQW